MPVMAVMRAMEDVRTIVMAVITVQSNKTGASATMTALVARGRWRRKNATHGSDEGDGRSKRNNNSNNSNITNTLRKVRQPR